jgi:hypothetical protein
MAGVRRARQRGVTQVNQWLKPRKTRTGSQPGGSGPGCSARPSVVIRWSSPKAAELGCLGGHEEGLRRTCGDAVGAQLGAHPVKRSSVNMGTVVTLPPASRAVWSREGSSSADGVVAGRSLRSSPSCATRRHAKGDKGHQHLVRAGWDAGPGLMQRPGEAGDGQGVETRAGGQASRQRDGRAALPDARVRASETER